jgi:hypothetical protein
MLLQFSAGASYFTRSSFFDPYQFWLVGTAITHIAVAASYGLPPKPIKTPSRVRHPKDARQPEKP